MKRLIQRGRNVELKIIELNLIGLLPVLPMAHVGARIHVAASRILNQCCGHVSFQDEITSLELISSDSHSALIG